MGNACCLAARDKMVVPNYSPLAGENLHDSQMMSSSPLSYYDDDCFELQRDDKIYHYGNRMSNHHHHQTCGVCSRPLSQKSLWNSQKIFMTNELSVSAILACGHVYHGECLEHMTLEIDKFDPSCPLCSLDEKKTRKVRHIKRLRNRVLDSDDDFVMFDHGHNMVAEAAKKSPKLVSSSSVKSYSAKPFLDRHFPFVSTDSSTSSTKEDLLLVKKKGFFWTKSNKI